MEATVGGDDLVPDAHDAAKRHAPVMTTADLALRFDPIYEPIARHFLENPAEFADAFARAWFKLLHRDMGPKARYLGSEVPAEDLIWQDPVPAVDHALVDAQRCRRAEGEGARVRPHRVAAGLDRVGVGSDVPRHRQARRRNGARIRLEPQIGLGGQRPAAARRLLRTLEGIQQEFNGARPAARRSRWPT